MWPNLRSQDRHALGSVFPPFNKAVRQTSVGELDPAANGRRFMERKRRICTATVLLQNDFALQYGKEHLRILYIPVLTFSSCFSFYSRCPLLFYLFLFLFLCSLTLFLSSYICFSISSSSYTLLCLSRLFFFLLQSLLFSIQFPSFLLLFISHSFILQSTAFVENVDVPIIFLRVAYTNTYLVNRCLINANYIFLFSD